MKVETQYTLQWLKGDLHRMHKWDDAGQTLPLNSYDMQLPYSKTGGYSFLYCNCPSRSSPCKHYHMAMDLINACEGNPIQELHLLWGEEGKVHRQPEGHAF